MNQHGLIPKFSLSTGSLCLEHRTQPDKFCEAIGHKAALLGYERGCFEAWVYPFKICHDLELEFIVERKKWILKGSELTHLTQVRPESTTIIYSHEGFSVKQILFVPIDEPGAIILLEIDSYWPMKIAVKFRPDLQPMWPAGLGGQYSLWDESYHAYLIAEGSRKYCGLIGSPIAKKFSLTPGHLLSEAPMEFRLDIDPEFTKGFYFPIIITGSIDGRETCFEIFKHLNENVRTLYETTGQHYKRLQNKFMTIRTPDAQVNRVFDWAKVALDKGLVDNPQLGTGLVAGYGVAGDSQRPGFAWFFGGDAFLNSMAFDSYGDFKTVRKILSFWREHQREDGKIFHEYSQSGKLINWFEEYPYGFYHAETTPYYIVAMHDYWRHSGDTSFIGESWDSIKRAFHYCLSADCDGDGLMENSSAGLAAMEVGTLSSGITVDIYLAALWLKALTCMIELTDLMNVTELKRKCKKKFTCAFQSFKSYFYNEKYFTFYFAKLTNGNMIPDITVWQAVPAALHVLEELPLDELFKTLTSADMSTDWGIRGLSKASEYYDPVNYNNGSVWPFTTGYVVLGEYNHHRPLAAFNHFMGNIHSASVDALGFHTELLSGEYFRAISTSVPHQLFSSSQVITPLVRGLLGLQGDAGKQVISFSPHLPTHWQHIEFSNYRIGKAAFSGSIVIKDNHHRLKLTTINGGNLKLRYSPGFAPGTEILSVMINEKKTNFTQEIRGKCVHCEFEVRCAPVIEIDILYRGGIEILQDTIMPTIGEPTQGLKIVDYQYSENILNIIVQGRSGGDYLMEIHHPDPVENILNARLVGGGHTKSRIQVSFPLDEGNEYQQTNIEISFKIQ